LFLGPMLVRLRRVIRIFSSATRANSFWRKLWQELAAMFVVELMMLVVFTAAAPSLPVREVREDSSLVVECRSGGHWDTARDSVLLSFHGLLIIASGRAVVDAQKLVDTKFKVGKFQGLFALYICAAVSAVVVVLAYFANDFSTKVLTLQGGILLISCISLWLSVLPRVRISDDAYSRKFRSKRSIGVDNGESSDTPYPLASDIKGRDSANLTPSHSHSGCSGVKVHRALGGFIAPPGLQMETLQMETLVPEMDERRALAIILQETQILQNTQDDTVTRSHRLPGRTVHAQDPHVGDSFDGLPPI
jgi:hypothetical protein